MPVHHAERPAPYRGTDPYIFVSYSHNDEDEAIAIMTRLQSDGYRVWYDEGLAPGSVWNEDIASHIEQCGCFIALVSNNYLGSRHCGDELYYAKSIRDKESHILLVYLEDVQMSAGMKMSFGRLQAIYKYTYTSTEQFFGKIYETNGIQACRNVKEQDFPAFEKSKISKDEIATNTHDEFSVDTQKKGSDECWSK